MHPIVSVVTILLCKASHSSLISLLVKHTFCPEILSLSLTLSNFTSFTLYTETRSYSRHNVICCLIKFRNADNFKNVRISKSAAYSFTSFNDSIISFVSAMAYVAQLVHLNDL